MKCSNGISEGPAEAAEVTTTDASTTNDFEAASAGSAAATDLGAPAEKKARLSGSSFASIRSTSDETDTLTTGTFAGDSKVVTLGLMAVVAAGPIVPSEKAPTVVSEPTDVAAKLAAGAALKAAPDGTLAAAAQVEGATTRATESAATNAELEASASLAAEAAADVQDAFDRVRKNRVACISALCQQAQRIERVWDVDVTLRRALLDALSACLATLDSHKEKVLRELGSLAPKIGAEATLRHFLTIALPIERQHTRGLRDDEFLVLRPDDVTRADSVTAPVLGGSVPAVTENSLVASPATDLQRRRMPLVVVMDNLRSAFNVGSVFRTSECLRVERLHLCGYTATPSESRGQTARASMGADANVPWVHHPRTKDVVQELRESGMPVFALETVDGAQSVHDFTFPSPCALLLGNERHGLEADVLALCSAPVRIPCHGMKNSLNVSVAFAVCAFEIARQWRWDGGAVDIESQAAPET